MPYRYVSVEGPISAIDEAVAAEERRAMAVRYLGAEVGELYLAATAAGPPGAWPSAWRRTLAHSSGLGERRPRTARAARPAEAWPPTRGVGARDRRQPGSCSTPFAFMSILSEGSGWRCRRPGGGSGGDRTAYGGPPGPPGRRESQADLGKDGPDRGIGREERREQDLRHYRAATPVAARHDLAATAAERREIGRQARVLAPRADLGEWDEKARGHDPVDTILAQNDIRLPELAPLRHQRMSLSPWNFYRGAAAVMAADLASRPHSRIEVQLCGDAHVLNFGLWATPERNLNFDLRDFDETLPGPFEWDVARLAASLVVAARENGVKPSKSDAAVTAAVDAYRNRMRYYATLPLLDIWYEGTRFDQFIDYFEPADRGQVKVQFEKKQGHADQPRRLRAS